MKQKKFMKPVKVMSILFLGIALASCKKYEEVPNEAISSDIVYDKFDKNGTYANLVRNDLYNYLPDGFNRIDNVVLDAATDDAVASRYGSPIELLSKSGITAGTNPDDRWSISYEAVRKANLFLSKVDIVPYDAATIAFWKAEARFIRAMNYFELIKRYGGVPLLGNKVYALNDNLTNIPRNTFEECVQYIVSECDAIKTLLRQEPIADTFLGTVPRGAAYALKSRVLLYAASPLNNPSNDQTKWSDAAIAAKDLMNLTVYSLTPAFNTAFLNRKNTEVILAFQKAQNRTLETANAPIGFAEPNASNGYVNPSQNLVDAFPMSDGRAINNTSATLPYNAQNPYANRDPRLGLTVFFNGASWLNRPVETFDGGLDKPGGVRLQTRTGYYMRKFLGAFGTSAAYQDQTHNFPIFRYAEILLNYAEAINETNNQTEAFNQLKLIRNRAGIPLGTVAGYAHGLKTTMTQAEMREAIRNERRIEMAFEEQRFWDIRRWKIAEQVGNDNVYGMKIEKQGRTFIYTNIVVDKLKFIAPKMYFYGIPLKEVLSNPSLIQNTGY